MNKKISTAELIEAAEAALQEPIDAEEADKIEKWNNGKELAQLDGFDGWEIAKTLLQKLASDAVEDLFKIDPMYARKHEISIEQAYSKAYGAKQVVDNFFYYVAECLEASKQVPSVIRKAAKNPTEEPLPS